MQEEFLKYIKRFSLFDGIQPSDDKEWIVTNGIGGYSSLTLKNENRRKFHGLLVASLNPPVDRWVFVSNIEERVRIGNDIFYLKNHIDVFRKKLLPEFLYDIDDITVKKTVFMIYGENTTIIKYEFPRKTLSNFIFTPILNSRHFYDLTNKDDITFNIGFDNNGIYVHSENTDRQIRILTENISYNGDERWIELKYGKDKERGDSWKDYALQVGDIEVDTINVDALYLVLTIENKNYNPQKEFEREILRRNAVLNRANLPENFSPIILSADEFVVKRGNLKSIIAGYHWFSDWGRDTIISLPGIALVTSRYELAREILLSFARYENNGIIPNTFADREGKPVYNTVDASLWFIDRVFQYLKYTNDLRFVENIWTVLSSIIDNYTNGTDFGIRMDNDFLISHNEGLTWMDVKIGNYYVTPRSRKAVEIQALWYNALMIMDTISRKIKRNDNYGKLAENVKNNFLSKYDKQYDVIDTKDLSCRPNKIFLASLDFSMMDKDMTNYIIRDIEDKLLTPRGLRTLSKDNPGYHGNYIGEHNKDTAYHNGTVWPWLIGPFVRAFLKIKDYDIKWRKYALEKFLLPLLENVDDGCIGSINEIFDGDSPYKPRGAISQAWSVAEILRTLVEDVFYIRPRFETNFIN